MSCDLKPQQSIQFLIYLVLQMICLVNWSLVDQEHANALSGSIGALKTSTVRLPVVNGAKVHTSRPIRIGIRFASCKVYI